jgi:hypothetical protein
VQVEQAMLSGTVVDCGQVETGPLRPGEKLSRVVVDATDHEQWGGVRATLLEGRTCASPSVAKPAERLRDPDLGDWGGEGEYPARVAVDLWHSLVRSAGQLNIEQIGETGRATPEVDHAIRNTAGLDTDRDDRSAGEGVNDHERIAARRTPDWAELISADEYELSGDAALDQPVGRPAR